MSTMSIHRALAELKTLDSRIDRAIDSGIYVMANKASNTKIQGLTIDELRKRIQGDYDKVVGLIARRNEIKSKVVLSNAGITEQSDVRRIEIAGASMTVAEAIERKSSIQYDRDFLRTLKSQFNRSVGRVNTENESLPRKLEVYLNNILGDKSTAKSEEIEAHTKLFESRNIFELIDPLQLNDKIVKLEDEIVQFELEVDSRLSEENAITMIELAD